MNCIRCGVEMKSTTGGNYTCPKCDMEVNERIIQERLRDGFAIVTPPSNVKKEIEEDWHKSLTEYNPSIMNCFSRNKKYLKVWEKEGISL